MRITIIGPAYPLRGGIAHHVYCLKEVLAGRGHEIQIISFRKLYPSLLFPGTTELDRSSTRLDTGGLRVLSPLNPITWYKAFGTVKGFSPDLIVFQWWQPFFSPMVGTLARWFRRNHLKCIMECHNVFPHESSLFDRWLLKFAFRSADGFITHSQQDRIDLQPFVPGRRIGVAPLPIPAEFAVRKNRDRSGRTILFFGKVRKYKGLDVLLAAMPKVLSHLRCQLEIVGEFYESVEKYKHLIHEYGIEGKVKLENRYVPNEEVTEVFDRADVLVLPYLSASQSAVAQVALANALPVIASRCGGLPEIVIENFNGLLFPAGDSNALARQIISFFDNNLGPAFAKNLISAPNTARESLGDLIETLVYEDKPAALAE